jgi:hypothetical protein
MTRGRRARKAVFVPFFTRRRSFFRNSSHAVPKKRVAGRKNRREISLFRLASARPNSPYLLYCITIISYRRAEINKFRKFPGSFFFIYGNEKLFFLKSFNFRSKYAANNAFRRRFLSFFVPHFCGVFSIKRKRRV